MELTKVNFISNKDNERISLLLPSDFTIKEIKEKYSSQGLTFISKHIAD